MDDRSWVVPKVGADGRIPRTVGREIRDTLRMLVGRGVRICLERLDRSVAANAYYWGVVIATIHQALVDVGVTHISANAIHCHFRDTLLVPIATEDGTERPSTRHLNEAQFHRYIELIRHEEWVMQLVHVPEPTNVRGSAIYEIGESR